MGKERKIGPQLPNIEDQRKAEQYAKVGAEILKLRDQLAETGLDGDGLLVATARAFAKAYLMTYIDSMANISAGNLPKKDK